MRVLDGVVSRAEQQLSCHHDRCIPSLAPRLRPQEIRKQFHIKNDFTPEEEEEVRRENQWAFD